jgi:drug/metabolite transporter (DMT)-like permease
MGRTHPLRQARDLVSGVRVSPDGEHPRPCGWTRFAGPRILGAKQPVPIRRTTVEVPDHSAKPWGIGRADGLLLLTAILWGVNFSVVKFALAEIPPVVFMGLRFLVASAAMLALTLAAGYRIDFEPRHIPHLIGLGLVGNTAYQLLFVFAISLTTAENSALILATAPAWVALVGTALGMERVEKVGWLGIGLSLAGIALIIGGSDRLAEFPFGGSSLRGDLLMLAGTLCWALYTLLVRPMTRRYSSVSVTSVSTAIGTIPLVLVGIPAMADLDWSAVSTVAWTAMALSGVFAIGLAYFFWNYGVAQLGSARTSIYSNLSLPAALATAWMWLGETLTPMQAAGTLLALGGVVLARRFTRPQRPSPPR